MNDLLKTDNLVELHEKLNKFATHYKKVGQNDIIVSFAEKLADMRDENELDGSKEGLLAQEGRNMAIKQFHVILKELTT